ncbi:MAG: flagellar filament capping protein FliD [Oscillospiraceae bacterium]|nr:flagellar filament capping protein FliD [Oscillospiraceae bacterium]MCL2279029.1 flagellar filament capping protein FliD [Oscillospiraceae bacterium]
MRISGGMSAESINSFFNALGQGQLAGHTNRLNRGNNLFSMPSNNAPTQAAGVNAETGRFVSSIRTAADSMSDVIGQLMSSGNRIVAVSSDSGSVSIQHTGTRPSSVSRMEVSVHQLAAGQVNEGTSMQADAAFEGTTGTNQFSITQGNMTRELSVNVAEGATNAEVQQSMANAINSANMGFTATVETNAETNESMLRIESSATGADPANAFTLNDMSGGNLVAQTGANEMASAAQNAMFTVNDGHVRQSASNTVFIGNGVTATFNEVTEQPVEITWGREQGEANTQAVRDLVGSFNDMFSAAAARTNDPRAQNLASRMLNVVSANSRALSEIGIGVNANGNLTIDSNRLNQSAEDGRLAEFFSGGNRGSNFGNQLSRIAESVTRNPASFVTNPVTGNQANQFAAGSMFDFTF